MTICLFDTWIRYADSTMQCAKPVRRSPQEKATKSPIKTQDLNIRRNSKGSNMSSFRLDESQRLLQDTVRRFAREKVAPRAQAIDETAEYPQDMFDALKELGL
ncbi:MAG: acyl-CoA dehydrogenase family protein, partial [Porticoccaceae bacterium]|nr:acyl-CoA dehydrogenase family protein [Porticoccaceae bacterium]